MQVIDDLVKGEGLLLGFGIKELLDQFHEKLPDYLKALSGLKHDIAKAISSSNNDAARQKLKKLEQLVTNYQLTLQRRRQAIIVALVNRLICLDRTSQQSDDVLTETINHLKLLVTKTLDKLGTAHPLAGQLLTLKTVTIGLFGSRKTTTNKKNSDKDNMVVKALTTIIEHGHDKMKRKLASLSWRQQSAAFPLKLELHDNHLVALAPTQRNIQKRWPAFIFTRWNGFVDDYLRAPDRLIKLIGCNNKVDEVKALLASAPPVDVRFHPGKYQASQEYQAVNAIETALMALQQKASTHLSKGWFSKWVNAPINESIRIELQAINQVMVQQVIPHKIKVFENVLVYMRQNRHVCKPALVESYCQDISDLITKYQQSKAPETLVNRLRQLGRETQRLLEESQQAALQHAASAASTSSESCVKTIDEALELFSKISILDLSVNQNYLDSSLRLLKRHVDMLFIKPRDPNNGGLNGKDFLIQFRASCDGILKKQYQDLKQFVKRQKPFSTGAQQFKVATLQQLKEGGVFFKLMYFFGQLGTDKDVEQVCYQLNKLALHFSIYQQQTTNPEDNQEYRQAVMGALTYAVNVLSKRKARENLSPKKDSLTPVKDLLNRAKEQRVANNNEMDKQLVGDAVTVLRCNVWSRKLKIDMTRLNDLIEEKVKSFWTLNPDEHESDEKRMESFNKAKKTIASHDNGYGFSEYREQNRADAIYMGESIAGSPISTLIDLSAQLMRTRNKFEKEMKELSLCQAPPEVESKKKLALLEGCQHELSLALKGVKLSVEGQVEGKLFNKNYSYAMR